MKSLFLKAEQAFEQFSIIALNFFGSAMAFIAAIALVLYWIIIHDFANQSREDILRDIILSFTFLSFFIIQKTFKRFSTALHLKLNELVKSHEQASNHLVGAENKTEKELGELARTHELPEKK